MRNLFSAIGLIAVMLSGMAIAAWVADQLNKFVNANTWVMPVAGVIIITGVSVIIAKVIRLR